jgi:hypothetical protein
MHCSRVDAFRHRAKAIIAYFAGASHPYPGLTLTVALHDHGCATNVIRHGLWPILRGAREALKPAAASFFNITSSP